MSNPNDPSEDDLTPNAGAKRLSEVSDTDDATPDEDLALADDDEEIVDGVLYRGRGRPRLPPDQKRREKLVISVTAAELEQLMVKSATTRHPVTNKPMKVQDWARMLLLEASKP